MTRPGRKSIAFVNERMLRGFGVDLVIDEVASTLAERGHNVTVYASVVDGSAPRPYRVDAIPTRASGLPTRYHSAARWWAGYIDAHEHDLIFIESFPYFSLIPRLRTPAVAVDHGVSSTQGMSPRQKIAFKYIEWAQQNRYFPKAAGLIAVSEYIRSLLPGRLRGRTRVIYNGGDHYPPAPQVDRQAMRVRLGLGDDRVMMLYVGRLNPEGQPYKGTADIIRASGRWREEAPKIAVVMAGRGDDADAARIRRSGGIPLIDVPEGEMAALYAAADIYLTASRWEGFDLPIIEAAYQGTPTVALRVGAHPEVVSDGRSGLLVRDIAELREAAEGLAAASERRRAMGEAARAWAQRFTWSRAADGYEEAIAALARPRSTTSMAVAAATVRDSALGSAPSRPLPQTRAIANGSEDTPDVTAVILNYGAPHEVLHRCVASLAAQTYPTHILLVDNGSPRNLEAVDLVEGAFPDIQMLRLDKNYGFAGGMNRGVAAVRSEYVLLLNNDVTVAPNAVEEMRRLIDSAEDVVGIAPKILLENPPGYIDAIGNLVDPQGQAYNMGIGQLDIGQYDRVEETFGACFAAALLRREAWRDGLVGPLDERYFMYYEDVDWCFRAGVLGYKFLTCPGAVVHHTHSMSTRQLAYGYKYRLIMRNFVRTVIKDFEGKRAWRVAAKRVLGLVRNVARGPYRWASLLAVKDIMLGFPVYALQRRPVQARRRVPDHRLFGFSHGEQGFFDPTGYAPLRRLETLAFMYNRKFLLQGDGNHRRIAEAASALAASRLRFDRDFILGRLGPLLTGEPPAVQSFLESIET